MRILFSVLHFGLLRNYESVVEMLGARGHEIVLTAQETDSTGGDALAAAIAERVPGVTLARTPFGSDGDVDLRRRLRLSLDYVRFLGPGFDDAPKLRARLGPRVPPALHRAIARFGRPRVWRALEKLEQRLPAPAVARAWLQAERPSLLILASTTHDRSADPDLLRAARELGIPVAVSVFSWDHLSSKALIRDTPDLTLVWNGVQRDEAVALHGLPADRVAVTGAQCYDQWLTRGPSRTREAFERHAGLPPGRPFVLYVCSALTPSPDEPAFVRAWVDAIRQSADPSVSGLAVLVRPHPERIGEWTAFAASVDEGVVVHGGGAPTSASAKADYFDALVYASATVGLVTSALLEAAIAGCPVLTITPPSFAEHQRGMRHFRYLLETGDGLPAVAATLDEHVAQLSATLASEAAWRARQQRFLDAFVHPPNGRDVPATDAFVAAVETVPGRVAARRTVTAARRLAGHVFERTVSLGVSRGWLLDEQERARRAGLAYKAGRRQQRERHKRLMRLGSAVKRVVTGRWRREAGSP